MASHKLRFGLSFIVGLGCWFGRVEAQAPDETPVIQARGQTLVGRVLPLSIRQDSSKHELLNRHGYACGQHLDWYGCGGWHAQNTFVFGSCRTFFGEPCLPNQSRGQSGAAGAAGCR
jgi:hypothetical protein